MLPLSILGTSLWHPLSQAVNGLAVMGIDPVHGVERLSSLVDQVLDNSLIEADIYEVLLSNGDKVRACLGSQFEVRVSPKHDWQVLTLDDILTWFPPLTRVRYCGCRQKPLLESRYELRQVLYYIPFTKFELGFPPYWLGVFLTRGCIACDRTYVSVEPELALRMRHQDTWDFFLNDLPIHQGGVIPTPTHSSTYRYELTSREGINTDVERELKNLEVWDRYIDDRYIHPSYLFSGFDERVSLIQGIMDSAGYVDPIDGLAKARLRSTRLVEDLIFLVRTIGGYARQVNRTCSSFPHLVEVYMPDPEYPFSRPSLARLWERTKLVPPHLYIDAVNLVENNGYIPSITLSKSEAYIGDNFLPIRPILIKD